MSALAVLAWRMLRYRVAAMLWLFLLLGAAWHGATPAPSWRLLAMTAALAASYVAATTVNDLADEDVDKVNHPADAGRPLVHGTARRVDLWRLNLVASVVTVTAAALAGRAALVVMAVSLVIAYTYSLRPLLLSYRTHLAALVLAVAYVLVPYTLGVQLAGERLGRHDLVLAPALLALFLARIVLKDFRDRAGDLAYGKPTLLLRHGKRVTCVVSLVALVAGLSLLVVALGDPVPASAVLVLGLLVASRLRALSDTEDQADEQVAIGVGAKAGNGLLVCVLCWLLLRDSGADPTALLLGVWLVAAAYVAAVLQLVREPGRVVVGYKG